MAARLGVLEAAEEAAPVVLNSEKNEPYFPRSGCGGSLAVAERAAAPGVLCEM